MAEELSGRELVIAVAERVMEWRRKPNGMMHGKPQTVFIDADENTRTVECGCDEDFNPVEDIRDAMQVVEKMRAANWYVTMSNGDERAAKEWFVEFARSDGKHLYTGEADCDSLAEAISRAAYGAALQAVGKGE